MKRKLCLGFVVALFWLPAAVAASTEVSVPPQVTLAIVGADVLPLNGSQKLADQTIIVSGDEIRAVGAEATAVIPQGAKVLDAHGLTLMPGLVDMHVHLPSDAGEIGGETQRMLAVMLASGVTTVRGMQGFPGNLVAREAVEQGVIPGPRIYAASLPIKDDNTETVEAARATVREAKRRGYDLIKSHNINSVDVWNAVEDEARRNGLPTAGHVTSIVGLDRALAAGQEVEHLDGALYDLLPPDAPERRIMFAQIPPPEDMRVLAKTTDAQLRALAGKVAAAGSFQVPTLAAFEAVVSFDRPTSQLAAAPEMRFVAAPTLKQWADDREEMRRDGFMKGEADSFVQLRRRIVRAYSDAGVRLMAGSDTPQNFRIPGPGLIQEVKALTAAGLAPLQALQAATVTPRDYFRTLPNGGSALGWKANFGTVEPGARADLILLRGDPSKDLSALDRIQAVIAGGRLYDRGALDALLDAAAAAANPAPRTPGAAAPSAFEPIIAKVAAALDQHPLVGIGDDSHRDREAHDLQMALISDPRILCKIDAIAVEFGNGALQDIADRYVSGQLVSEAEKRRIWRDTGQWLVWDSPLYEDFFDQVRALNARHLCAKPVRVLLADPPIDWPKVHSAAQYKAYRIRDAYFASVVEREILAKGKHGLIIAGDSHLWKALPAGTAEKPLMGMLVEAYAPGALASFTFPPNSDETAKAGLPPPPSLTLLRGTQFGQRDFGKLVPDDETILMNVGGKSVGKRLDSIPWPPAEQVVDGLLNLGPLTEVDPDPAIYWNDPAYVAELRRRAPILKAFYGFDFLAQLNKIMKK